MPTNPCRACWGTNRYSPTRAKQTSPVCPVRKHFQNKILEIFLSPFNIYTHDQDYAHKRVGALTKFAKAGILYIGESCALTIGRRWSCRRNPSRKSRSNCNLVRFSGTIRKYVRRQAERKRTRGGDAEILFLCDFGLGQPPK